MEFSYCCRAVDVLHKILHNITCKDAAHRVTNYQVYPPFTSPHSQLVQNEYIFHLQCLFYRLGLLYIHNSQIQKRELEQWNALCSDRPYEFIFCGNNIVQLVIHQENTARLMISAITPEELAFLNQCQEEFLYANANANAFSSMNIDTNAKDKANAMNNFSFGYRSGISRRELPAQTVATLKAWLSSHGYHSSNNEEEVLLTNNIIRKVTPDQDNQEFQGQEKNELPAPMIPQLPEYSKSRSDNQTRVPLLFKERSNDALQGDVQQHIQTTSNQHNKLRSPVSAITGKYANLAPEQIHNEKQAMARALVRAQAVLSDAKSRASKLTTAQEIKVLSQTQALTVLNAYPEDALLASGSPLFDKDANPTQPTPAQIQHQIYLQTKALVYLHTKAQSDARIHEGDIATECNTMNNGAVKPASATPIVPASKQSLEAKMVREHSSSLSPCKKQYNFSDSITNIAHSSVSNPSSVTPSTPYNVLNRAATKLTTTTVKTTTHIIPTAKANTLPFKVCTKIVLEAKMS